jgi:NADH dehydrogenase
MSRTVYLDGATGFVGGHVLRRLREAGFAVRALVNREKVPTDDPEIVSIAGGLFDKDAVREAMRGCIAAIHLVGIIMEKPSKGVTFERIHADGTRAVLEGARETGVKRFVQMSALGTRANAVSRYHQSKWIGEEHVRSSGLDWTIFRPSMIHGPDGEFMQMAASWARKRKAPWLFMPYFGAGVLGTGRKRRIAPVYVEDVAEAFVRAIDKPETIGRTIDLVGADTMTWPAMHQTIAQAVVGRRRWVMPIPAWYAKTIATITPASLIPFNKAQVQMALEDNTGDPAPMRELLGIEPRGFEATLKEYAGRL